MILVEEHASMMRVLYHDFLTRDHNLSFDKTKSEHGSSSLQNFNLTFKIAAFYNKFIMTFEKNTRTIIYYQILPKTTMGKAYNINTTLYNNHFLP